MASHKASEFKSATILNATSVSSRKWGEAIKQVAAGLSQEERSGTAYAIVVRDAKRPAPGPNYLATAKIFAKAYKLGLEAISGIQGEILKSPPGHLRVFRPEDHIRIFVGGKPTAKEVRKRIDPRPGIYIIGSHLNAGVLADLALPPAPRLLLDVPLVIQIDEPALMMDEVGMILGLGEPAEGVSLVADPMSTVDRDSIEWRKQFMSEYPRWTSADIAQQSTSLARNQASTASRWAKDQKIFAIDYQGQRWFPKFQFQDGRPIPAVGQVLEVFPKHATGWQLAYFFATPNGNISGRKPYELLKEDPSRVVSLAQAFAHPADVF